MTALVFFLKKGCNQLMVKMKHESGLMIPRSGNFKGNFLLLAIKWRLRSSFNIANRYKFASFLFVCSFLSLFLRIFWSHGSFTVKESSCPEKCCSLETKDLEKLFYRLPACCPRSSTQKES